MSKFIQRINRAVIAHSITSSCASREELFSSPVNGGNPYMTGYKRNNDCPRQIREDKEIKREREHCQYLVDSWKSYIKRGGQFRPSKHITARIKRSLGDVNLEED